jgi:Peptidase family M28
MLLPREAGTPAAREARGLITRFAEDRGYRVREQQFSFHPISLSALPIAGAGLGWLTLLQLPLLLWPHTHRLAALGTWVMGATALGMLAWGIGTGVDVPGAEAREDANLIVTRGTGPVYRWIVAHVDSKAQGHSMAGRLVAVWLLLAATLAITLLAIARTRINPLPAAAVAPVAGLALAAGALAARGRLRGSSPGARDNGTGLLAAFIVVAECEDPGVGFLFTGAEEFGLVGARVAAQDRIAGSEAEVINLDTLDHRGSLYLVYHDTRGAGLARRIRSLVDGIAPKIVRSRLPIGILTDSLPFARRGIAAVTLGRLDWGTLRLIHTPRDLSAGLDLGTANAVGRAILGWPWAGTQR